MNGNGGWEERVALTDVLFPDMTAKGYIDVRLVPATADSLGLNQAMMSASSLSVICCFTGR